VSKKLRAPMNPSGREKKNPPQGEKERSLLESSAREHIVADTPELRQVSKRKGGGGLAVLLGEGKAIETTK